MVEFAVYFTIVHIADIQKMLLLHKMFAYFLSRNNSLENINTF